MNQNGIKMTVVELIEKLQDLPLDAKIICDSGLQGQWFPSRVEVREEPMWVFSDLDKIYYVLIK